MDPTSNMSDISSTCQQHLPFTAACPLSAKIMLLRDSIPFSSSSPRDYIQIIWSIWLLLRAYLTKVVPKFSYKDNFRVVHHVLA